jgi:hypothetical protein
MWGGCFVSDGFVAQDLATTHIVAPTAVAAAAAADM